MKLYRICGIGAFAFVLGLAACGDDSSSNSDENGVKGEVITLADGSGEKVCDEKLEGWVAEAFGKDFRRCQNGEWTKITASEASAEDEIIGGVTVLQSSSSSVLTDMSSSSSILTEDSGSSSSVKAPEQVDGSSSSVIASEAKQSSSSVVSSSSVTSSSSVESSSSVVSSSSEKSSSSVASSSSVKSSSSVASSSSAKSSSSVASSSSAKSSSSKANWAYLNPAKTYGTMTDSRDGQVYKTIKIGTQTWMAENLNYAYKGVKFDNGYYTSDSTSWCYDNDPSECATYGRLYTWAAAMDSAGIVDPSGAGKGCGYSVYCDAASSATKVRGVCPSGWHLPSYDEWNTLFTNVGGTGTAGQKLKSTSGWYDGGNGTDSFGFSVLPAGRRYLFVDFNSRGSYAYFWSSTEYESYSGNAWYQDFYYDSDGVDQYYYYKYYGFSVRCLKD